MDNRISLNIERDLLERLKTSIDGIITSLPDLITLTTEERRTLPKMGDKSLAFVEKALEFAEENPDIVPAYMETAEFRKDIQAVKDLQSLINPISQILEKLEDSQVLAGSEAYVAALTFYNSVKTATRSNIPGAKLINDELKERFPSRRKPKDD